MQQSGADRLPTPRAKEIALARESFARHTDHTRRTDGLALKWPQDRLYSHNGKQIFRQTDRPTRAGPASGRLNQFDKQRGVAGPNSAYESIHELFCRLGQPMPALAQPLWNEWNKCPTPACRLQVLRITVVGTRYGQAVRAIQIQSSKRYQASSTFSFSFERH